MARIRIDDLPVGESLTPEEEALLLGAGLKSFRPTVDYLEARELMSANPVTAPAFPSGAPLVRQAMNMNQTQIDYNGALSQAAGNNILQYNMSLHVNSNQGRFDNNQLSPRVEREYLGKRVGWDAAPHITWQNAPKDAKSFALVMEDISVNPARETGPDPRGRYTHWVVYNIPKDAQGISPDVLQASTVGVRYEGPNPPKGEQAHTYVFTLYALNTDKLTLDPSVPVTAEAMRTAVQASTIGQPAEVRIKFGY
jgi:Raf kinase inhibitor-like YbhB/YbcL family protein